MDGDKSIVTKGADMATQKGILVIVSAGNEGNGSWKHITAPSDGDSVMSVGAVNNLGNIAGFSGVGPTADGRIKPNVVAMGSGTAYSGGVNVLKGDGTSFSCPLVAGMAACLWQANKFMNNMQVFETIQNSASRISYPDNSYGYGIPNFELAFYNSIGLPGTVKGFEIQVYPNPVDDRLVIEIGNISTNETLKLSLSTINGTEVWSQSIELNNGYFDLDFPFPGGVYIMNLEFRNNKFSKKIIK